jgi:cation-transporting ATPase I
MIASMTGLPSRARTVGLAALVGTQLGQTAVIGGRNPLVLGASAVSLFALGTIIQTPVVSQFFGCTPLDPLAWAIALGSAATATAAATATPRVLRLLAPSGDFGR